MSKLIYIPLSFLILSSIPVLTFEIPHYSNMDGFWTLATLAAASAVGSAFYFYKRYRDRLDGENLYTLTGSAVLFTFLVVFAYSSLINRKYATMSCETASYKVVDYEGRYTSGYQMKKTKKNIANQWLLTILKDGAPSTFVLTQNIFPNGEVTKEVQLEFCRGMLHTAYLQLPPNQK